MANLERRNGIWYARYKGRDGSWKYRSCGKKTLKADAIILASKWENEENAIVSESPAPSDTQTLYSLFTAFSEEQLPIGKLRLYKTASTIKRERNAFRNFVTYCQQKNVISIEILTTKFIIGYLNYRKDVHNVKPKTLLEERRVVRLFFDYVNSLDDSELIRRNPVASIPAPRVSHSKTRYFTEKELDVIFDDSDDTYRPIFQFLYLTGLRSGELCNLRWKDYYPEKNRLVIRGSSTTGYTGNKYHDDSEIPTSPKVKDVLELQRGSHPEYIFVNSERKKLKKNQIYKILWTILQRNNIKDACVHTFRHTTASHLVIQGVSIYKVSKYLRHSSVTMTEIYAHLQPDNLIDEISLL